MDNHQPQGGATPKPPPIPTYASKVASTTTLSKIQLHTAYIDPTDGHLAALTTTPTKRLAKLVNPGPNLVDSMPIICSQLFIHNQHARVEIVYHEALDSTLLSNTPVMLNSVVYPRLSFTVDYVITKLFFSDFQIQSSAHLGTDLATWIQDLIETEKEMGKVIKIDVPLHRSPKGYLTPGHQVIAYVKGTRTPEDVGLAKSHRLPGHQKVPIRIQWTTANGAPFCNYCKSEGHLIGSFSYPMWSVL
ncbi:hypothetical protein BGX24_010060 [Mortierella sp. AD032]|nr:hypothetical protein BGX24_010060 [Mortierella sp. AD032]